MINISVPMQADSLNDILKQALLEEIVLEAADGQRFVLASIEKWKGFYIGDDDDITGNTALMAHLSNRRSGGKITSLSDIKEALGLQKGNR